MNTNFYLNKFRDALERIDKTPFEKIGIELFTGIVMESAVLKAYKPDWSNNPLDPLNSSSRIFFSIWVNEKTIREKKLLYNIHAFKLRDFDGYQIRSREFAERFREAFADFHSSWPNAVVNNGPLTLIKGWMPLNDPSLSEDIAELTFRFLKLAPVIDETLAHYKI